jgi:nucleoside-diphosphate-sugar epimerase
MRVFVTGATGFIGSAIVRELIGEGHQVLGLARSDEAAAALTAAGAEVHRGALDDLGSLRDGAAMSDGVIHAAFIHDFSQYESAGQTDLRAVETIGAALAGSDRPFVVTSGTALLEPGRVVTEEDAPYLGSAGAPRIASEHAARSLAPRGVRVSVLRLPVSVHGEGDHGFIPALIDIDRAKGASAYIGDGANRWSAVHRLDAARLFRLALESAPAGSTLHGVADEAVPFRDIAAVIGRHLDVPIVSVSPEEASDHFGPFAGLAALDNPASSRQTRERLGWTPTQPGLIEDLDQGHYFNVSRSRARVEAASTRAP